MQFKSRTLTAPFLLSGMLATVPVHAFVIVDQLSVATTTGIVSTASDFSRPFQIADGFAVSMGQLVRVTRAEWVGDTSAYVFDLGGSQLEFRVRIFRFADDSVESTPIADIDVTSVFTESPTSNSHQSLYAANINPPIALPRDGTYFFSVVANTPDTTRDWTWFFLDGPTMSYNRFVDTEPWTERLLRSYSFRLTGELSPAPATLLEELTVAVIGVGPGQSLANMADLARSYYEVPDIEATCAVLTDFVSHVNKWSSREKPKIGTDEAAQLIGDAETIMDAIGCN